LQTSVRAAEGGTEDDMSTFGSSKRSLFLLTAASVALACSGCDESEPTHLYEDAWDELHGVPRSGCSGVVPPDSGPFDHKIALTFDDGPHSTRTAEVMDILESHGARGTFFVNGRSINSEDDYRLLHDMVERGHILANHTENHPNSVTLSAASWDSEISQTHDELVDILGEHGQTPKFFRFPYGSANCDTYNAVTAYGYSVVGWHIDSADWCYQSSTGGYGYCSSSTFGSVPDTYRDDFIGLTLYQANLRDGGVLLFHDIHSFTAENLDGLMTRLEEEGYTFTTLDDVDTFPRLNGIIPEPEPWVGQVCESDADCAFEDDGDSGYCHGFEDAGTGEARGFCVLPCAGYCPDRSGTAPTFCVAAPEPDAGMCVSKTHSLNTYCDGIPGTVEQTADRFIGDSVASASTADVCLPPASESP